MSSVTDGAAERDDVKAAMDILRAIPGIWRDRIGLVGYSFGAAVILGGLKVYKSAKAMALISPPVAAVEASNIGGDKRPRLFLLGERDRLVNWADMREKVQAFKCPPDFQLVSQADHSWEGFESEVASRVADFLTYHL